MPNLKTKVNKPKLPIKLPDGSALLQLGLMADADFSGVMLSNDTLKKLSFAPGQWIEIKHGERGTSITRMVLCADCEGYVGLHGNRVYLDQTSVACLAGIVDDIVSVKHGVFNFDIP